MAANVMSYPSSHQLKLGHFWLKKEINKRVLLLFSTDRVLSNWLMAQMNMDGAPPKKSFRATTICKVMTGTVSFLYSYLHLLDICGCNIVMCRIAVVHVDALFDQTTKINTLTKLFSFYSM